MQLKINYKVFILLFVFISCSNGNEINEEINVIIKMYNSISKSIPPPPKPSIDSEISDSIINKTDFNSLKTINFKYAINKKFINFETEKASNRFRVYKSKELITLTDEDYSLVAKFNSNNSNELINEKAFIDFNEEEITFIDQQFINKEDKKEKGIDGIVSFSKVSFSDDKNKAAIAVGIHRGKLDSSLTIYILERLDEEWKIKSYNVVEVS